MIGTSAPHRHGCFRAASGAGQMDSKKMRKTHVSTRSAAARTANRLACSAFPECNASFFIFLPTFVKVYNSIIIVSTLNACFSSYWVTVLLANTLCWLEERRAEHMAEN
jgi:hypothetical protein